MEKEQELSDRVARLEADMVKLMAAMKTRPRVAPPALQPRVRPTGPLERAIAFCP
jgi:hypothetical protein